MLRFALFLFLAWAITPAAAFGAGNIASIAKIEGKNCTKLFIYHLTTMPN